MLNHIVLMGRMVADPEVRRTQTGKQVAAFRIACDRGRKDASGQSQADFFDVTAWEKTGEFVGRYFGKGSLILIEGRLQSSQYTDKNGSKRTAISVVASQVHFTGEKARQATPSVDEGGYSGGEPAAPAQNAPPAGDYALIEDDDDLPF